MSEERGRGESQGGEQWLGGRQGLSGLSLRPFLAGAGGPAGTWSPGPGLALLSFPGPHGRRRGWAGGRWRDRGLAITCEGSPLRNSYRNLSWCGTCHLLPESRPSVLGPQRHLTPGLGLINLVFSCLLKRVVTRAFAQAGQKSPRLWQWIRGYHHKCRSHSWQERVNS